MTVFPIAYFPSILYCKEWFQSENSLLEIHENFPKQTIRNRCEILTGNGVLRLSVPVVHQSGVKIPTHQVKILQTGSWKTDHWRAVESAYSNAPYFEDYAQEIQNIIFESTGLLLETNLKCLELVAIILDKSLYFETTTEYLFEVEKDFRNTDFSAKENWNLPDYQQVFSYNKPFTPNLSIIDLIFNEGPFCRKWIL
jgi:hypothetical protein